MSDLDTDLDNYSYEDLISLFGLSDAPTIPAIDTAARPLLAKARSKGDEDLINFLESARDQLKEDSKSELDKDKFAENASEQLLQWREYRYPPQDNEVQMNKLTDRYNKVETFDSGTRFPMERQRLGVNSGYVLPVAQGNINPNLKNLVTRMISLDSQYRPNLLPWAGNDPSLPSFNTDFTVDLTDPLPNVVSLQLHSVQIPTTWYPIDTMYGNTCLEVSGQTVWIQPGAYTPEQYADALNAKIKLISGCAAVDVSYSTITSKYTIDSPSGPTQFKFYQPGGFNDSSCVSCVPSQFVSQNVGWTMGWRLEPSGNEVVLDVSGSATADAAADLNGPKYFSLVLDDYNKSRSNMGLVSTAIPTTKLDVPSYTSAANVSCDPSGTPPESYVQTAPRRLTQAQLFTINQILEDREAADSRIPAPNPSDVLGVIPLRNVLSTRPQPLTEVNTAIRSARREYFGPVNLSRLRLRLLDDRGNLVDLHGAEWSILLTANQLYQY